MKFLTIFLSVYIALFGLVSTKSVCIVKHKKEPQKPEVPENQDQVKLNEHGVTTVMENVEFVFANKAEGAALISQEDDFVNSLSDFDRILRTQSPTITKNDYINFIKEQTMDWTKEETESMNKIIEEIKTLMKDYNLQFPQNVFFVKTTGLDEFNSPYCRGSNIIVIPQAYSTPELAAQNKIDILEICIHELFHIFSRNNPDIREKLYNSFGFYKTGDLVLPPEIAATKITNPDSLVYNHYFKGIVDGKNVNVMPILYFDSSSNEPLTVESLMNNTRNVFAEVELGEKKSTLVGKFYTDKEITNFYKTVGTNKEGEINPEEIIAYNFPSLVTKKTGLPNPEIIDNMKEILGLK